MEKRGARVWFVAALSLAGVSVLALVLARGSTGFSEWYSAHIYSAIVRVIGGGAGLLPFSLGEMLIYLLTLFVIVYIFLCVRACIWNKSALRGLAVLGGRTLVISLSAFLFLFTFNCGINYYRPPFSQLNTFSISPASKEELAALCEELIGYANMAGENAEPGTEPSPLALARQGSSVMQALSGSYEGLSGYYPPAKPVLISRAMSYLDLLGIYFPPTVEANFNADAPAHEQPSSVCHELSHLRGFMREDEANFIAFLACRESGDAHFTYSGYMLALVHSMNALYATDRELYFALAERYSERVKADFSYSYLYWKSFEGPAAQVSSVANDIYLKANSQADGVKSYGRMVDLLISDYRTRHSLPM